MSEIECAQLHNELFRRRHSTRQSHGLFALAKLLLPYDAGLSSAAETLAEILKRVIVSPAVYPRFLEIAELARSLCHS